MGLSLSVGYLAEVSANDPEASSRVGRDFERLNSALIAAGREPYQEPTTLDASLRFSCDMWGYSGLHHLRRIAAHLAYGLPLPEPMAGDATKDLVLKRYYEEVTRSPTLIGRLLNSRSGNRLKYQHLIVHSDAEGYYVPHDFTQVVFADASFAIPGAMIGSAPQLREECRAIRKLLEIPDGLDSESDTLYSAAENPTSGEAKWQRYGIESFSCMRLLAACDASVKARAAIVFC